MLRISMVAGLALLAAACGEGGGADRDEAGNIAVTASRGPAGYAASPPPVPVEVYASEDLKAQGAPSMTF